MDNLHNPDLAQLLQKLRTLQPDSAERQAYLDELARKVRSGEYKPDPQKIARKLVEEAMRPGPPADDEDGESAKVEGG